MYWQANRCHHAMRSNDQGTFPSKSPLHVEKCIIWGGMALCGIFEYKNTFLFLYFNCLLLNLQMCQIILPDPVYLKILTWHFFSLLESFFLNHQKPLNNATNSDEHGKYETLIWKKKKFFFNHFISLSINWLPFSYNFVIGQVKLVIKKRLKEWWLWKYLSEQRNAAV